MSIFFTELIGNGATTIDSEVPEVELGVNLEKGPIRFGFKITCNSAGCNLVDEPEVTYDDALQLVSVHRNWHSDGMPA